MYYIQRKDRTGLETVDEANNRGEAAHLVREYQLSDFSAEYSISRRACNNWLVYE